MSSPLSATQLADMRATVAATFVESCDIQRVSAPVSDGRGGRTGAPATVVTVACRIGPAASGGEIPVIERLQSSNGFMITMPAATDVRMGDRIVSSGRTFEVTGLGVPRSFEIARRVRTVERKA